MALLCINASMQLLFSFNPFYFKENGIYKDIHYYHIVCILINVSLAFSFENNVVLAYASHLSSFSLCANGTLWFVIVALAAFLGYVITTDLLNESYNLPEKDGTDSFTLIG